MTDSKQPPAEQDPVRDYIRQHIRSHNEKAIRAQLIAAGHDPGRVNEVWEEEWREVAPEASSRALDTFAGVLLVIGALPGLLLGILALFTNSLGQGIGFLLAFGLPYLLLGLGIRWLARWVPLRFRLGSIWTGILALLLLPVYAALMLGSCVAGFLLNPGLIRF